MGRDMTAHEVSFTKRKSTLEDFEVTKTLRRRSRSNGTSPKVPLRVLSA